MSYIEVLTPLVILVIMIKVTYFRYKCEQECIIDEDVDFIFSHFYFKFMDTKLMNHKPCFIRVTPKDNLIKIRLGIKGQEASSDNIFLYGVPGKPMKRKGMVYNAECVAYYYGKQAIVQLEVECLGKNLYRFEVSTPWADIKIKDNDWTIDDNISSR